MLFLVPARVLQSMWELLLRMILDTVAENRGIQVEFYNRFQYTVEVSAQCTQHSLPCTVMCSCHTASQHSAWLSSAVQYDATLDMAFSRLSGYEHLLSALIKSFLINCITRMQREQCT